MTQALTIYQELWLKALESGNWCQCIGTLHGTSRNGSGAGHCCLGVADIVLSLNESDETTLNNTYEVLGLHGRSGEFQHPDGSSARIKVGDAWYSSLTCMNDGKAYSDDYHTTPLEDEEKHRLTFQQIAQAIREHPDLVFRTHAEAIPHGAGAGAFRAQETPGS